jgi:hypothetical protein
MTAGPPGTPAIVAIQLCFSGPRSEGEMYVQNIGSWSEDRALFQDFSERTFSRQQLAVEEVLRDGRGRKWYIKSDMLASMTDDVIEKTCDRFPGVPDGCSMFYLTRSLHKLTLSLVVRVHRWWSCSRRKRLLSTRFSSRISIHSGRAASMVTYRTSTTRCEMRFDSRGMDQ